MSKYEFNRPPEQIYARVKEIRETPRGNRVITTSEYLTGEISFPTDQTIWQGQNLPNVGDQVVLSRLEKSPNGWYAKCARPKKDSEVIKRPTYARQQSFTKSGV